MEIRIAAMCACLALAAACSKGEKGTAGTSTGASTAAAPAAAPAAGASATAAPAALTDANIAWILDQANGADSARGNLAETKATEADVKSFGKLMVGEHHALRKQGQDLVKKLNVTPTAPAGDSSEAQAQKELDSLNAMPKGKAWDKAYIDYEVNAHQQVIQTATKAEGAAQNPQLKDLIKKAGPVLEKHLKRAQEIQKKLGG